MIVLPKSRRLLLRLRQPQCVQQAIPQAVPVMLGGAQLLAVRHRDDEVRLLRNLGLDAPAPVSSYYDWPGRHTPYAHQRATVEFLTANPRAYCTSGLGSGKTLCGLWAWDWLRGQGAVRKLLVLSPLSTLEAAWGAEIFRNFPHLTYTVLHGAADKRMALLENRQFDIYIINHDGLKNQNLHAALCAREDIDSVIIDELASFRNPSAMRWKALAALVNGRRAKGAPLPGYPRREYVWGFTGTPTPNAPTDAYAQCRLITPWTVPGAATAFRDMTMRRVSPFKWVPGANAIPIVQRAMQPCIRFAREDCIDLPPTTYITRQVDMSAEQASAYDAMRRNLVAQTAQGLITAVNEGVMLGRLLQICAGASYDAQGASVPLPCQSRIDEALRAIDEADAKTIVFVPYTAALEQLAAALRRHHSVEVVTGKTSKSARDRIFADFQAERDPHILLANPGTVSHGLTLTAADTIIWFAPVHSNEIWEQANGRIARPGQTRNTRIVCLQGAKAEERVYERLRAKGTLQGLLLDMLRGNT